MKRPFIFIAVVALMMIMTGCATSNKAADYEWVGGIMGGNVVYSVNKLGPNKFLLEANTVQSVTSKQLIAAYKTRGAKLCEPKTASYKYKVILERYMGTFNSTMKLPMTAPKIMGVVTCK